MTPRIAIPAWRQPTAEKFRNYEESLRRAGGLPVRIAPGLLALDGVDGLLIPGGPDVDPRRYGERRSAATQRPNVRRDEHELSLLRAALERGLPVLAVCRGHQLLNAALGGSLVQNVPEDRHRWHDDDSSRWHEIRIEPDCRLAAVYGGAGELRVNSRHHQAVTPDRLAASLRAVAYSPDGFVEAVEGEAQRWLTGVQWHPERPEMRPAADPLFSAFVSACRA